jgi:hypothetical protein
LLIIDPPLFEIFLGSRVCVTLQGILPYLRTVFQAPIQVFSLAVDPDMRYVLPVRRMYEERDRVVTGARQRDGDEVGTLARFD